jgi:outer membrane biosynthesis protein TonB
MYPKLTDRTVGKGMGERPHFSAGFVFSVALHALVLLAVILVLGLAVNPIDIPLVVPVDIVQLAKQTVGPKEPEQASIPQQKAAAPSSPDAKSVDLSALKKQPPPDKLEVKLRKLAQLRDPIVDPHLPQQGEGLSRIAATRPDAALGSESTIKDFLRDQIEHHWSPDLSMLHGRSISVSIRIALTSAGVVTRAEIVNSPALGVDSTYDDIAISARNAVLLASPLTLPPGHYARSMDLIVNLNTRDALR